MTPTGYATSADGVRIAYYSLGEPGRPVVVAVHGYPDNAGVWQPVAALLAEQFQVVSYDVRGAGNSDKPTARSAYRLPQLLADFEAVVAATAGGRAVHLLGHDWGSVQGWHFAAVLPATRVASFSSISGPSLAHARPWVRAKATGGRTQRAKALRQLGDSYYLLAFQLPLLPELGWRSGLIDRVLGGAGESARTGYVRGDADKLNGLNLYRANLLSRGSAPARTEVPVQVLAPRGDPFITVAFQTEAPAPFTPNLTTTVVPGGHWIVLEQSQLVADWVAAFIHSHEPGSN